MKRKSGSSLFSLSCGCRDSKSVTVSDGSEKSAAIPRQSPTTLTSSPSSSSSAVAVAAESLSSPSFSGLLRQLNDLEQSVMALEREGNKVESRHHRRCRSEGGWRAGSVAVVTDSDDPLADFRRSMLQMIVEKEIVGGEELRQLLRRFLALNSPRHHDLILRAFSEVWADISAACERTPDALRGGASARFH